jgi:male sterility protein
MATFLSKAVADPNSAQDIDLTTRGREVQALVDNYTESFPTRLAVNRSAYPPSGNVYLLTGTTGGLGSNVLAQLLQAPDVERVYAFNRPSNSSTSQERQLSAFKTRGLDTSVLASGKVVYVEGDLSVSGFALDDTLYGEVSRIFSTVSCAHTTRILRFKTQSRTSFILVRRCLCFSDRP